MRHTENASDILFALCAAQPGLTFIMVAALQHIWRECVCRCQPARQLGRLVISAQQIAAAMQGDRNYQTAGVIHGVKMTCDKPPQNRRQMQRITMFEWQNQRTGKIVLDKASSMK